ncbi:MAG: hypothetical protein AB8B85_18180 [Paracoccaceae bacterium]
MRAPGKATIQGIWSLIWKSPVLQFSRTALQQIEAGQYRHFLREVLALHRRDCSGLVEGLDDPDALAVLDAAVKTARGFDFLTEALIRRFLVIQAVAGHDFHQDPKFSRAHPYLHGSLDEAKASYWTPGSWKAPIDKML